MSFIRALTFALLFIRPFQSQTNTCFENGELRLLGGETTREGRVEICIDQQWGTVCDNVWSNEDAQVVCRQLTLPSKGARAVPRGFFEAGSGPIWLNNVACMGWEAKLLYCSSSDEGLRDCNHSSDAGVLCPPEPVCEFGDVRLIGGTDLLGRVEICVDNTWGTICDTSWNDIDAKVVCREIGHSFANARALFSSQTPDGSGPIWLENVQCNGTESRLVNCLADPLGTQNCNHEDDVGVRCQPANSSCSESDVRIVGGRDELEGHVEVCRRNTWGTVCNIDESWRIESATVVCRQLGYSTTGAQAINSANSFGIVSGDAVSLVNVECFGSERRLSDCPSSSIIPQNCTDVHNVGVRCQPQQRCNEGDVRLVGGRNLNEGRVEICDNSEWGTICDDSWGSTDATVVCSQLRLPSSAAIAVSRAGFGSASNTVQIFLDNVNCIGNEMRLLNCQHSPIGVHNCGHLEDAGVICQGSLTTVAYAKGEVRLNGGNNSREGLVEIFQNNQWGTVCGFLWDESDASVVCRQLGFSPLGALALDGAVFGRAVGPIWLSNVQCIGNESRLADCRSTAGAMDYRCDHSEDAGVRCYNQEVPGPPRNLHVVYSSMNCSQVFITWDPPESERVITGYSINLTTVMGTADLMFRSSINSLKLTSLACCTEYSYSISAHTTEQGPPSSTAIFKTLPNITDRITVFVSVLNDTTLSVEWSTPDSIIQQDLTFYFVSVISECYTNVLHTPKQKFTIPFNGTLQIDVNYLEPFIPYLVSLNATICNSSIQIYNQIIYTQRDIVQPPVIMSTNRNSQNTAATVHFTVPPSEDNADYFVVSYYNHTELTFNPEQIISTLQTTNRTVLIYNLEPCQMYWVTVTSINCGSRIDSNPKLINLKEPVDFRFNIILNSDLECNVWLSKNKNQTLVYLQQEIYSQFTFSQCDLHVPCIANSALRCDSNSNNPIFETTLVNFIGSSGEEQDTCLNNWVKNAGTIEVQGNLLTIELPTQQTDNSNTLLYVWVTLAIAVAGIILAVPLGIIATLYKKIKPHPEGLPPAHKDIDGSIMNVIENRLYEEDSAIEIKDESEPSTTSITSRKKYPINFNPPEY